jgi:lipid-A-disaccharide synthase
LFCLFKKEVEIFKDLDIDCVYTGNPFVEKFLKEIRRKSNIANIKQKFLLNNKNFNILLLPGSRDTEIKYILLDLVKLIKLTNNDNISWFMPTTKLQYPKIIKALNKYNYKDNVKVFILEDNYEILKIADLAVACSGTITLELTLFSIPTIALYKSDWLSSFVGRCLVDFNNVILPNFFA